MAKKKTGWKILDVLISLLVAVGLINWGLVDWLDFNLVEWLSFGYSWIATALYSVVAVIGFVWLITVVVRLLK